MLWTWSPAGQFSRGMRWLMSEELWRYAPSRAVSRPCQPRVPASWFIHSCNAWVCTVRTLATMARQAQVHHPVEEPELHAALLEHQVERSEHHVAHPGLHLVGERPLVSPGDAQQRPQGHPRGEVRARQVAVLVGEDQVVQGPHGGR